MERTPRTSSRKHVPTTEAGVDVLIVEDEHVARNALWSLLTYSGYRPAAYASAEEVLDSPPADPRDGSPRIALIDVDLPGMSGLELADRLEKRWPGILNVIITAADGERIEKFLAQHTAAYFRKPIDFQSLLELIGRRHGHN
jgi:FixJ family two-component response regulator